MRLCDKDIKKYLANGEIKIAPEPSENSVSGVTVDVRLGNKFRVFVEHQAPFIDLGGPKSAVQEALDNLMKDRTSIVIAHRLGTIKNCDEIIVLEAGKIIEKGTYTQLIEKKGFFENLHALQTTNVV